MRPLAPVNGKIHAYTSTEDGAEIMFMCHNGLNQSTCINSTWHPDPLQAVCTLANPGNYYPT